MVDLCRAADTIKKLEKGNYLGIFMFQILFFPTDFMEIDVTANNVRIFTTIKNI